MVNVFNNKAIIIKNDRLFKNKSLELFYLIEYRGRFKYIFKLIDITRYELFLNDIIYKTKV